MIAKDIDFSKKKNIYSFLEHTNYAKINSPTKWSLFCTF
jgi:hypothetical protein